MDSYFDIIRKHYETVWSLSSEIYLWDRGPIEKLPSDCRILVFPPTARRSMWTYATCGMSQPDDDFPVELHIFSETKNHQLIELLTSVVYFHRNSKFLGLNHTVNFGRPWQYNSKCEFGFISLPYLDGPELEKLKAKSIGIEINFYWLVPVTRSEVEFKKKYGVLALEDVFDKGFNYLDTERDSLV